MSGHHEPASCELFHDPLADTSTAHTPTAAEREVLTLLWPDLPLSGLVRLSVDGWRTVGRLVAALAATRLPHPREGSEA